MNTLNTNTAICSVRHPVAVRTLTLNNTLYKLFIAYAYSSATRSRVYFFTLTADHYHVLRDIPFYVYASTSVFPATSTITSKLLNFAFDNHPADASAIAHLLHNPTTQDLSADDIYYPFPL